MDPIIPLDTKDPNIPSRVPNGKLQAAQQPTPRAPPLYDRIASEALLSATPTNVAGGQLHVTRPSLTGIPSFQRPRKRVVWRNKACFIALPLEDSNGNKTSRESYLSPEDFERRLKDWEKHGFDTNGFTLAPQTSDSHSPPLEGQSRAVHPDPEDEKRERADGTYRVKIPDRRHWEAYVNHLKENKLRALGVDEHIPSNSPALSVMSRQGSSQSSVVLTSPTLASSSHVGPFPTSFYSATNPASYIAKPGVSHFPRYSIAHQSNEPSLVPLNQMSQPSEPQRPGTWSPQTNFASQQGSRVASPGVNGHVQTFARAAPPGSPRGISNAGQASNQASTDLFARMREQQALLQIQQLQQQQHHHQQQQQILQQRSLPSWCISLNGEQILQPVAPHNPAEIASPIPRGHPWNLSENLQKGANEAEAYVSYSMHNNEEREESRTTQNETVYDENQAKDASNDPGRAAPQNARANGSVLDASPSVGEFLSHETNHPGQCPSKDSPRASQLNVNAPNFEPGSLESPGIFSFLGNRQAHKAIETDPLSLPSYDRVIEGRDRPSQPGKWNVAAPEFTPKTSVTATVPSREFSFSALRPSFRPDAPTFKPSDSGCASGPEPAGEKNVDQPVKIFGDISFSEVIRPPKSKAIPITKPNKVSESKDKFGGDMDGQEDESGRITQADGRQKRMRRERDDGDQVPLFASSEGKSPWIDRANEDRAAHVSRTPSPESDAVGAATLNAATDLLEGLVDDLSATEASDLMREVESVDGNEEIREAYAFNDLDEAASFNAARPPNPHEVARATQDFLGKSPQFATEFNRALGHRTSSSESSGSLAKHKGKRYMCKPQRESEDLVDRIDHASQGTHANIMDGVRYVEPSYNELDAIMKHLNRVGSDLGVERQPSPWRGRSSNASPIRYPGPKLHDSSIHHQLQPPANTRSDAPSPSPNRLQENYQYLPPTDSESANPSLVEMVARSARYSPSYRPSKTSPPMHPLNSPGSTPPSDWDDTISSLDEDKLRSKTTFDTRVNEVTEGIVQRELKPLEQALSGIQQSLAKLSDRSPSRRPRSSGTLEIEHSDADDEDDVDEVSQSMLKSPLRDRKFEQLKASISEIAAAQQSFAPASQLVEMMAAVKDLKASIQENISPHPSLSGDIKNIVEEAVGRQMRGRSAPVTSSSQAAAAEKSQLQIAGLESMLKIADARANDEMQARRSVEDELADQARSLRIALHEASEQRESAEATERSLLDFHTERQQALQRTAMLESSQESLQKTASDLSKKVSVLEETLAEYRLSSDQWRSEISDVKHENTDLRRIIGSLNAEIEESFQGRQALRAKIDHLQEGIAAASRNLASDHMRWLSKEEEHHNRLEILSAGLESEARTRERLELEIERIEAQEMEVTKTRSTTEQMQKANAHLESLSAKLKSECHDQQSVITRLNQQIDHVTTDADRSRSRYELMLEEASDSQTAALEEATCFHQRTVNELRAQHECTLDKALEDRQRSETYFGNQLSLADEKVVHYQDRVSHLEEKLEIAKSAAHAAVQAAQSKKAVLDPSSPCASLPVAKASDRMALPEKISPQALRESILVLQEQLQEREIRVEQLEHRLSSVDVDAPEKLKDAEVEITWLRELLGIRIEDLNDLIATVSQPSYNPVSVKDAAIRLKANLQMEQQEKERALASFPSLARISNLTASPKALPLAAAAAWSNWRKGRDSAFGNVSANQTLSTSSPQSFLAGLMTPPSTATRTAPPFGDSRVYPSLSKRSVRAPTSSKQSSSRQEERHRPLRRQAQQHPVTPPLMRKDSYDLDASEGPAFGDEAIESNKMAKDEEPFGPNLGGIVGGMERT